MTISRIAVVADIHCNLPALQAAWAELVGRDGLSSAAVRHRRAATLGRGR
jgi:hypothetical protein